MFITHSLSFSHRIWLLLVVILASCDSTPSTSSANSPVSTPIVNDSFPTTSSYTKTQLAQRFRSLKQEADPTPALHYQLLVPKDWQQVPLPWQPITPNHPSQLKEQLQAPIDSPPVQLRVVVLSLDDEVSPADILFANLARHGDKIIRQELTSQAGGVMPDVLALSGEKGAEQITRWTIRKNTVPNTRGTYLFMLSVGTPANHYSPEMAQTFCVITSQFKLLYPTEYPYAEQLRTLVRVVPTRIATAFPCSWQQRENPSSNEHFYQVQFTKDLDGQQIGRISLTILSQQASSDLDQVEEETLTAHAEQGLHFATSSFKPAPDFGGLTHVQTAASSQLDPPIGAVQERHVIRGQVGAYWVYMESIHFTSETAHLKWAICKRGFEIVQEHLVVKP